MEESMDLATVDVARTPDDLTGGSPNCHIVGCRTFASSCSTTGCVCIAITKDNPDPECAGTTIACPSDPCAGQVAQCSHTSGMCRLL